MAFGENVKDWTGKVIGMVDTDSRGNQTVKDFAGKVLGYYDAEKNITKDWTGRKVSEGNTAISFIYKNQK